MRITYVGSNSGTSLHRCDALRRLGHEVTIIDPASWLPRSPWVSRWLHHGGAIGVGLIINNRLQQETLASRPNVIIVNQGEFLDRGIVRRLSQIAPIANYMNDDPFGGRDGRRFNHYLSAIPEYDMIVVVREPNVEEAKRFGAKKTLRIFMSADEVAHAPRTLNAESRTAFASDVLFIGTWMPERGPFLAELVHHGVPLSIRGDRWQKAKEWPELKPFWKGPGLYRTDDYAAAIQCAKVSLGLLSIGNRDEHTTRSMEIPLLGGMLCAQRTPEHMSLYVEGEEAEFWDDAKECAEKCQKLLVDPVLRDRLAAAGQQRINKSGHLNERVMASIIEALPMRPEKIVKG